MPVAVAGPAFGVTTGTGCCAVPVPAASPASAVVDGVPDGTAAGVKSPGMAHPGSAALAARLTSTARTSGWVAVLLPESVTSTVNAVTPGVPGAVPEMTRWKSSATPSRAATRS